MSLYSRGKNTYRIEAIMGYDNRGHRKRITETFKGGEKEAVARENEIKAQANMGTYIEENKVTFEQFADKWISEYAEPNLAPKTIQEYKKLLSTLNNGIGHFKLKELKPLHLLQFYNELRE